MILLYFPSIFWRGTLHETELQIMICTSLVLLGGGTLCEKELQMVLCTSLVHIFRRSALCQRGASNGTPYLSSTSRREYIVPEGASDGALYLFSTSWREYIVRYGATNSALYFPVSPYLSDTLLHCTKRSYK